MYTVILLLQDTPGDTCFYSNPLGHNSGQRTGVSSVGHELWAGMECRFRVAYYDKAGSSGQLNSSCTIQSKHDLS